MRKRSCTVLGILLASLAAGSARASSFVVAETPDLVAAADVIVRARVSAIQGVRSARGRIHTRVLLHVEESLKGQVPLGPLTLKQPGGEVGGLRRVLHGSAAFQRGEHVLVFLTRAADGSLHTSHLAMGKFGIRTDRAGRRPRAIRSFGRARVFDTEGRVRRPRDERDLEAFLEEIRGHVFRHGDRGTSPLPALAPPALQSDPEVRTQDMEAFTLIDPPSRFFEPDLSLPVTLGMDPAGDIDLGPALSGTVIDDAMAAWNGVSSSNLVLQRSGAVTPTPILAGCDGESKIVFNDPFDEIDDPIGCSGTLAVGGGCFTATETTVVGGTTFLRRTEGDILFADGFSFSCSFKAACNYAQVATHELGHVIGLAHSSENSAEPDPDLLDATMYFAAIFDGRCAAVRSDDIAAVSSVYPLLDVCGNGILEAGEACDDANTLDGDCCSASCQLEDAGTLCRAAAGPCDVPEVCSGTAPSCPADAQEADGVTCDDGNVCTVNETCLAGSCTGVSGLCGDGTLQVSCGEECDDSNNLDGDGCSASCVTEFCGDGLVQPGIGEMCDAGPGGGLACCSAACQFAGPATVCRPAISTCDLEEVCSGTAADCPADLLAADGTPCSDGNLCTLQDLCSSGSCVGIFATCGDGTLQAQCGEECDDGNNAACDGCSAVCKLEEEICGAQSKDQRKCIVAMNRGLGRVAKARTRNVTDCLKDHLKGRLGGTIEECVRADGRGRVAKASGKTVTAEARRCLEDPPDFGATGSATVNAAAVREPLALVHAIFGSDLDAAILDPLVSADGVKCQRAVTRAVARCLSVNLKTFRRCKKKGLKDGSITSGATLRSLCAGADPGGKILRACDATVGKLRKTVDQKCALRGVDLQQAFPGCNTSSAAQLAACLEPLVDCHACQALAEADAFGPSFCDLVDNGIEDGSCGEIQPAELVAKCGPGLHWVDGPCDAGVSVITDSVTDLQVDLDGDCLADLAVELIGDTLLRRSAALDVSLSFPGPTDCGGQPCGLPDGHLDVMDTEIDSLITSGGGVVVRAGRATSAAVPPSLGTIVEAADGSSASSFFDVFLQIELGGLVLYNQQPFPLSIPIQCFPPEATYQSGSTCLPLFDAPSGGTQIAALVSMEHSTNRCGNGIAGDREECDGADDGACPGACLPDCSCPAVCGNGQPEGSEECDDGNLTSEDGCSDACVLEFCGDGILQPGLAEECDDGNGAAEDGCTSVCTIEFCGDGVVQPGLGEQCDDGATLPGDGCDATCRVEPVLFSASFSGGLQATSQCTDWESFRAQLGTGYETVTLSGSFDPVGVTCTGSAASQVCAALRDGSPIDVLCAGRRWVVGTCGSGSIELSAEGTACQCHDPGHVIRPCTPNSNWGGANTETCGGPSQTIEVLCGG